VLSIIKDTNLINDVRPVISRIFIIPPQEIGMLLRIQNLVILYKQNQSDENENFQQNDKTPLHENPNKDFKNHSP
jgi:hypothetical protein